MPFPTVVPQTVPDWEIDNFWPPLGQFGIGSAFQAAGYSKYNASSIAAMWSALSGAAANNMNLYSGVFCGQFTSSAGTTSERTVDGISMYLPIDNAGVSASFRFPSQYRVWWLQFAVAMGTASNFTDETGFVIEPAAGVAPGWIKAGNRGFGIVGNGAGGFQYVSKNAGGVGVYSETVPLTWPNAITAWTTVDYLMLASRGGGNGSFNLYLNNTLTLTRAWGAGTLLPDYSSPANAARFTPHFRMGDGAINSSMQVAALRFRAGQYNIDGAAL